MDDRLAHGPRWAVEVHRGLLLRQDAHAFSAVEQNARGHRFEKVQRLAVGNLFAVAKHEHHSGTWLVAKLGTGNVHQGMAAEPVGLGRDDGQRGQRVIPGPAHAFGNVGRHAFDEDEVALPTGEMEAEVFGERGAEATAHTLVRPTRSPTIVVRSDKPERQASVTHELLRPPGVAFETCAIELRGESGVGSRFLVDDQAPFAPDGWRRSRGWAWASALTARRRARRASPVRP